MKKNLLKFTLPVLASAFALQSAQAASVVFDGSTGSDYNTGANWNGDNVPGAVNTADRAFIGAGFDVTLDSAVTSANALNDTIIGINGAATGSASLTVNAGGSVNLSTTSIGFNKDGELAVAGGTVTTAGIGLGDFGAFDGFTGALSVSSGTLNASGNIQTTNNVGIFNLSGGAINAGGLQLSGTAGTLFNWDFTSGASSLITVSGNTMNLTDTDFSFDLTGVGIGDYTLIQNNGTGIVDFTGSIAFTPGYTASVNFEGNASGDNLVLSVTAIPEPSTFALIGGLLALGSVMMRRRS